MANASPLLILEPFFRRAEIAQLFAWKVNENFQKAEDDLFIRFLKISLWYGL